MVLPLEPFPHRLSTAAPTTAIEKRETAVLAYEKDSPVGQIIWETERPSVDRVNQAIRDVLVRRPARFYDVTVQQVEQEDAERKDDVPDTKPEEEQGESDTTGEQQGGEQLMTVEEMGMMKMELHQTLGLAWNELNKIAELCRSLIPAQPHPYVLPPNEATASVPAKSLAYTPAERRPPLLAVRVLADSKEAVVKHVDAVKKAQSTLGDGAGRLKRLAGEEEGYWRNVLSVSGLGREGGETGHARSWALLARPLGNGIPPARQIATDVMIPYAPNEAGAGFRALAMATMVPHDAPQDTTAEHRAEISYASRRNKRLRICIKSNTGETYSRVTGLAQAGTVDAIAVDLGRAQTEMFDDEVFEAIRVEARNTPTLNARSSLDQISIDAVPGQELVFEMVDTEDLLEEQRNGSVAISTRANLLSSLLRLGMLRIYRSRASPRPEGNPTRLLAPVVAYMHYQAFCQHLFHILEGFQRAMRDAGLELEIRKSTGGVTGGLDWQAFMGDAEGESGAHQSNLKGNVELLVNGRSFCTILLSTDAHLTIIFSHTTFNSQDIAQLPLFLGQELRREIISVVMDELEARAIKYHADEVAGVIKTKPTKLEIAFTLDDPPRLWAQSSRITPAVGTQHSRIAVEQYSTSAGTLVSWAMQRLSTV